MLMVNTSRHQQLGGLSATPSILGDEEEALLASCCSYLGVMLEHQRLQDARLSQLELVSAQEKASRLLQVIHSIMTTPDADKLRENNSGKSKEKGGKERGGKEKEDPNADAREEWIRNESQAAVAKIAWCLEAQACRLFLLGKHRAMQGPYLEWTAPPSERREQSGSIGGNIKHIGTAPPAINSPIKSNQAHHFQPRVSNLNPKFKPIKPPPSQPPTAGSNEGDIDEDGTGVQRDGPTKITRVPLCNAGIAGLVARKSITVNLSGDGVKQHASYKESIDSLGVSGGGGSGSGDSGSGAAGEGGPSVFSLITMPIHSRGSGNVLAVIQVVNKKTGDRTFSQLDEALLSSCCYYIGANLHNVRLRQQLAQSEAVSNELLLEMLPPHVMRQLKGQIQIRRMSHSHKRFRCVGVRERACECM
jgi:hypothetical protein